MMVVPCKLWGRWGEVSRLQVYWLERIVGLGVQLWHVVVNVDGLF